MKFPLQTHAEDGDETLGAIEVDTEQEDTQLALPLGSQTEQETKWKIGRRKDGSCTRLQF